MNRQNKVIFVSAFLFLLTVGLVFDTANRINNYGWKYTAKQIINDKEIIYEVNNWNSIKLCSIFSLFLFLEVSLLIEPK
jgi:hypothetical protein